MKREAGDMEGGELEDDDDEIAASGGDVHSAFQNFPYMYIFFVCIRCLIARILKTRK